MKKFITRFTALSLSMVMLLGLTACGGGNKLPADVETPPAEEVPANDNDLPPRWDIDTGSGESETHESIPEPTPEPTADPRILGYDFPNSRKVDDGTANAPKEYVVTLHGGVELTLHDDAETQCVKLAGFGKTVNTPSSLYIEAYQDGPVMELPFSSSLSWDEVAASARKLYELRDDVTFRIEEGINEGEVYAACPPKTVVAIPRAQDDYNHELFTGSSGYFYLYNPTENDLPFTECQVAAVGVANRDGGAAIHAADVYALLGEPACVTVKWDSSSKYINKVNYYWAGDGFYFKYTLFDKYDYYSTSDDLGRLLLFADSPIVLQHGFMDAEAAALLRSE